MFDQYNQALIAASYGQLSLSSNVSVLPEVMLTKAGPPNADNFQYYEAPARSVRGHGRGALRVDWWRNGWGRCCESRLAR
jgi:hypothetical protein